MKTLLTALLLIAAFGAVAQKPLPFEYCNTIVIGGAAPAQALESLARTLTSRGAPVTIMDSRVGALQTGPFTIWAPRTPTNTANPVGMSEGRVFAYSEDGKIKAIVTFSPIPGISQPASYGDLKKNAIIVGAQIASARWFAELDTIISHSPGLRVVGYERR